MSLSEEYADYLTNFAEKARGQVEREVAQDGFGSLRSFAIREEEQGVFVEVEIDLQGEVVARWGSTIYKRRNLIIVRDEGPVDDASFAADLFSTVVIEDLFTCGRSEYLNRSTPEA